MDRTLALFMTDRGSILDIPCGPLSTVSGLSPEHLWVCSTLQKIRPRHREVKQLAYLDMQYQCREKSLRLIIMYIHLLVLVQYPGSYSCHVHYGMMNEWIFIHVHYH